MQRMEDSSFELGRRQRSLRLPLPAYDASLTKSRFSATAEALRPCVLVRTYSGNRNGLVSLLWSLLLSGHPNLRAFVVDTSKTPATGLPSILHSINTLSGRSWVEMSRRTIAQDVTPQFPGLNVEDYGYALTDLVMEDIMNGRAGERGAGSTTHTPGDASPPPLCDTLTVTNGDNVYSPDFFRRTLGPIADQGKDMVGTNWITHYDYGQRWHTGTPAYASDWCGPHRSGATQEMKASPVFECNCIDLGAVTFRLKQVQQSGIRFLVDKLRANETLGDVPLSRSDCMFFKRFNALSGDTAVVHEALFMHN
jgi:hypothetical protein